MPEEKKYFILYELLKKIIDNKKIFSDLPDNIRQYSRKKDSFSYKQFYNPDNSQILGIGGAVFVNIKSERVMQRVFDGNKIPDAEDIFRFGIFFRLIIEVKLCLVLSTLWLHFLETEKYPKLFSKYKNDAKPEKDIYNNLFKESCKDDLEIANNKTDFLEFIKKEKIFEILINKYEEYFPRNINIEDLNHFIEYLVKEELHLKDLIDNDLMNKSFKLHKRLKYFCPKKYSFLPSDYFLQQKINNVPILEEINEKLKTFNIALLHGIPGVGKKEIAANFVYKNKKNYQLIWDFNAQTTTGINSSFLELYDRLEIYQNNISETRLRLISLLNHEIDSWLLIFNDALYSQEIFDFVKKLNLSENKNILITSVNANLSSNLKKIEITKFSKEESRNFLAAIISDIDKNDAELLAEELGYLPIALYNAGIFIRNTAKNIKEFLAELNGQSIEFFDRTEDSDIRTLRKIFIIHFSELNKSIISEDKYKAKLTKSTIEFLKLCSCIKSDYINLKIFKAKFQNNLDNIINGAYKYGFIKIEDIHYISMHKLIKQIFMQEFTEEKPELIRELIKIINNSFKFENNINSDCLEMIGVATQVLELAQENNIVEPEITDITFNLACFYEKLGYFETAIGYRVKINPEDSIKRIMNTNEKAGNFLQLGNAQKAEELYQIVEELIKQSEPHDYFAHVYNDIGLFHIKVTKDKIKAEYYIEKALNFEANNDNCDYLINIYNNKIKIIYELENDIESAINFSKERINALTEKYSGKANLNFQRLKMNTGMLLLKKYNRDGNGNKNIQDIEDALIYFNKANEALSKLFDSDNEINIHMMQICNSLGCAYAIKNEHENALNHFNKAIKIAENVVGKNHPYYLEITNNKDKLCKPIM